MHDRAAGDLCPECATPFDPRPDLPGAGWESHAAFWIGVLSIVMLVPASFIALLLGAFAVFFGEMPTRACDYRATRWQRRRLRIGFACGLVAVSVVLVGILVSRLLPGAMNWW
ncbi:MAG: hypothetical protein D6692_01640 [Planctomycetota bacterium]|nr:MAG: hypothetical protein D6692_01640 [Planctomycetota bacterium]